MIKNRELCIVHSREQIYPVHLSIHHNKNLFYALEFVTDLFSAWELHAHISLQSRSIQFGRTRRPPRPVELVGTIDNGDSN